MCRNPRVWAMVSEVEKAARGAALIALHLPVKFPYPTAPGGAATIFAFVASAVGHHQHAAFAAGWSAFVGIARRARTSRFGGFDRRWHGQSGLHRSGGDDFRRGSVELQVIGRDEPAAEPARQVIQHRRYEADVGVGSDAAGFKA